MILKGGQRGFGGDLATHLLNGFDNEAVELAELRGTVASDLHGAFAEIDSTAAGTRCTEPLYSLSISPPEPIDRAAYFAAIDRIEQALKLEGQARAVVFHEKNGREHCHVVWSRIYADGDQLKAVHMSHDHNKLCAVSCALFREMGHPLPEGLAAWEARQPDRHLREGQDYTRAEKMQSEATGITVAERRAAITEAYRGSDTAEAFLAALEERGYVLARGDKRGLVVLDHSGEIFSLARQVEGATAKDIRAKLAALTGVPDVQKAKAILKERAQARMDHARDRVDREIRREQKVLHRRQRERAVLLYLEGRRLSRQQAEERLALKAKHKAEADALAADRNRPVRRFLDRMPGLGALLRYFEAMTDVSMLERQRREREALERQQETRKQRLSRADSFLEKVERREEKALASRAMAREVRRSVHAHRRAMAEGQITSMPKHGFVDPDGKSTVEWYRERRGTAAAEQRIAERHREIKDELLARRRDVHRMRQNAADITTPPAEPAARRAGGLGPIHESAASLIAKLRPAKEGGTAAPPPNQPPPDPHKKDDPAL